MDGWRTDGKKKFSIQQYSKVFCLLKTYVGGLPSWPLCNRPYLICPRRTCWECRGPGRLLCYDMGGHFRGRFVASGHSHRGAMQLYDYYIINAELLALVCYCAAPRRRCETPSKSASSCSRPRRLRARTRKHNLHPDPRFLLRLSIQTPAGAFLVKQLFKRSLFDTPCHRLLCL